MTTTENLPEFVAPAEAEPSAEGTSGQPETEPGASGTDQKPEQKEKRSAAPIDPRLIRRARATRAYMMSGVVVGCLTAVMVVLQAKLLSSTIASVFASHTMAGVGLAVGLLILVLAGRAVLAWASSWLAQRTSAAVKSQLRRDILAARLNAPAHQTISSSSLVTLVTQGLDSLDGYFSKYLPQLLLAVTVPIIVGLAILISDWSSAVIIAVTIPFIPILMALVGWTTEKQVSRRWAYQSRLASHFADLVAGLPTLQVFGRAKAQAEGLKRTENANRRETMAILRISFMSALVLEMFSTIAVAVVALVIGTRLVYSHMDFSTALFVLILAPEVYLPIRQVGVHYHDSADGLAAAEAAFAEIDRAGTPADEVADSGAEAAKRHGPFQWVRGMFRQAASGSDPDHGPAENGRSISSGQKGNGSCDSAQDDSGGSSQQGAGRGNGDLGSGAIVGEALAGGGSSQALEGVADHGIVGVADRADQPISSVLPPSILARHLTYTYPDSDTPIGPFDLKVRPGEIVALAGRSGGGKTTLLNCVLGFLTPDQVSGDAVAQTGFLTRDQTLDDASAVAGSAAPEQTLGNAVALTLGGVDARAIDWAAWRAGMAYVAQTPGMIDGTIADNVRLGCPDATDEQVRQMLDAAGAANLDQTRGVGEEGEGLSVGERRRVGIARALARIEIGGARLLVLDEPTAGLDADTEAKVLLGLRESGATALVVSHREAVLEMADRVVQIGQSDEGSGAEVVRAAEVAQAAKVSPAGDNPVVVSDDAVPDQSDSADDSPVVPTTDASDQPADDKAVPDQSGTDSDTAERPEKIRTKGSPLVRLVLSLLDSVPKATSRLVWAIIFAAFASAAAVALMGVSAWLISKSAEHPPYMQLLVAASGVQFFGISRGCFRYIERLVGHDVALSMQSALRLKTYKALARTTLLGRRQGDLLVRVVADVGAIEDIVVRIVQPFLAASLVVVVVCALLARFSIAAALAILVSAIIGGLIVPWLTQRGSLKADEQAVPLRGELGVVVHDLARTAVDLAAYGAVGRALDRMGVIDLALRKTEERTAWANGIGAACQTLASGIGFIGGLWIGSMAVADGAMGQRLLAVLAITPLALHEVFATFSQAAQTWTRARVALNRVTAILDAEPVGHGDVDVRDASETPALTCQDLVIGWPGYPPVASGLDLELAPGEAIGVMGPSGIGKTTLAATVMGLIPPVAGELSTSGRIGYLAQDAHIFTTTIAENVRIGNKDATDEQVREALAEAGLDLPLDRQVGEMGAGLSGGEVRRLALARLFAGDYRLLILDEPTEHLDRDTADTLMDEIFAGVDTRPVLVVSHDETVAARCDRVLTMG